MSMSVKYDFRRYLFCRLVKMLHPTRLKYIVIAVVIFWLLVHLRLLGSIAKIYSTSSHRGVSYHSYIEHYLPKWDSLDKRPLPQWYDDAKFGIFITWGVYSVPGYCGGYSNEWFWHKWRSGDPDVVKFMKENYPPNFTYGDFAASFGAELFNPDKWAEILKASGARYIVTLPCTDFILLLFVYISLLLLFVMAFVFEYSRHIKHRNNPPIIGWSVRCPSASSHHSYNKVAKINF